MGKEINEIIGGLRVGADVVDNIRDSKKKNGKTTFSDILSGVLMAQGPIITGVEGAELAPAEFEELFKSRENFGAFCQQVGFLIFDIKADFADETK